MSLAKKITYLLKHSGVYSIAQVLARLSGFFLMYITTDTRYVSTEEYAGYGFFISACVLSSAIFSIGMESALVRNLKMEPEKRKTIVNSAISIILFSLLIFTIISISLNQQIADYILRDEKLHQLSYCIAFVVVFDILSNFPIYYYRAEERPGIFTLYKLLRFSFELAFVFFGIRNLGMGIVGGGIGLAAAAVLNFIIVSPFYFKHYRPTLDRVYLKKMLAFGFPLMLNAVLYLIIEMADRYFIDIFLGKNQHGAYLTMYKFGAILTIVNGSFRSAWHPIMLREAKENDNREYFAKVLTYFMIFSSLIMVFSSLLAIDIIRYNPLAFIRNLIKDPVYLKEGHLLSFILMGYVFLGAYYNLSLAYYVKEKSINFAIFALIGFLVNMAINVFIIIYPKSGTTIAAFATFMSFFVMAVVSYIKSRKIYPVNYEKRKIFWIFLYMLFVTALSVTYPDFSFWKKLFLAMIYPIYLVVLNIIEKKDIQKLAVYIRERLKR